MTESHPTPPQPLTLPTTAPAVGQLVLCRDRHWIVADVAASQLGPDQPGPSAADRRQHLVTLVSVEDDGLGEQASVIWELEPGAAALHTATLPSPRVGHFDPPERQAAFLDAIRWGAVTNADAAALQSPFRAGISIEDYQLDPVVRALEMPRVNLGIFDDVGLGKTIEAGLVIQELLLRHRARSVWVVCPPNLCLKWRDEMHEKFGLEFRIVDSTMVRQLRRDRGLAANVFTHYPRLIMSIDWLKRPAAQAILAQALPAAPGYPRALDILVVDEVHQCAPSGVGKYATDSLRTTTIRGLAPHFEHRLFLSATPHNGYRESFTALLELLDPQKFARGVEPNEAELRRSVVRRLKSTMRADPVLGVRPDGTPRFTERVLTDLPVAYPDDERRAHELLAAYTKARRKRLAGRPRETSSLDFVTVMLKKRLFSSPEAFAKTLAVHRATIERAGRFDASAQAAATGTVATAGPATAGTAAATGTAAPGTATAGSTTTGTAATDRTFAATLARPLDEDFADDDEALRATEDALVATAAGLGAPTAAERALLDQLQAWADDAAGRPDAKTAELMAKIDHWLRPKGRWTDERLIIFTEYRDTQNWLHRLLLESGIDNDRVDLLYGGMDPDAREQVKRNFQADPAGDPVRILLATDAASEGIDLQRHCRRMVHLEIPWNPNRLEQRNGRIDRHLQPYAQVFISHFVSADYEAAPAGSLDADLQFLALVARKVEQIRDDLGSVGQVLSDQVSEAMLGRRRGLDTEALASPRNARAKRQLAAFERDLRERMMALHDRLDDYRADLGLTPEAVERAVNVGLVLGRQSPLVPMTIPPARTGEPPIRGFRVPPLTRSWAQASAHLHHEKHGQRPITFDQTAAGRDDVVLEHLGSRLVAQSLRLLRAQIWSTQAEARLSRVSAQIVDDPAVTDLTVIAHARIVITGGDGRRLHEEVIYAGGRVRAGRFAREETLATLRTMLDAPVAGHPTTAVEERIVALWPPVREPLFDALTARARTRFEALAKRLDRAAEEEKVTIAALLTELRATIAAELDRLEPDVQQLTLDLPELESTQLRADVAALRARVEAIPGEITAEQRLIDARYADQHPLMFPAAVTILVPAAGVPDIAAAGAAGAAAAAEGAGAPSGAGAGATPATVTILVPAEGAR